MSTKTNRKEKEPTGNKPEEKKETDIPGGTIDKLIYLFIVVLGFASVYCIRQWVAPPSIPEVDLDENWGKLPMDQTPDVSINQFEIEFSDFIIQDLKERLLHRRPLPPPLENAGFTYGFNSHFLTHVVDYWANSYNFKERERFLNQYNHFTTKINGLNIHFMHVKPQMDENIEYQVVPLLMLHGWPGSVREFYEIVPSLIKPRSKNFVFEVIAPSLPGFGFSEAPSRRGFGPMEMAVVIRNLMERLGVRQYYIQAGDVGHTVASIMATLFPDRVLGLHTNLPAVPFHPTASLYHLLGSLVPSWVEEPALQNRLYPYSDYISRTVEESGYMHIQATKPDTIGAALSDSPAGLAAYILEKFSTWTNPDNKKAYDGNLLNKFSLTHLLDNVMIYWTTNSITTSMRIYAESLNKRQIPIIFDRIPTEVPTWGIKFRNEIIHNSDSMLKLKYKNYLRTTIVEEGGHFATLENPELMANDIFEAVHTFRMFHGTNKNPSTDTSPTTVYDFTVNNIYGKPVSLQAYKGYALIIVNVASQCGLTDTNYRQLNELYTRHHDSGLRILAFPCNQFNSQEPGSSADIVKFTKHKGIQFDLFEKVDVNGEGASPLWKFLKQVQGGTFGDFIKWNFSKFLVDRNGVPVQRYGSNVNPMDIEADLLMYL